MRSVECEDGEGERVNSGFCKRVEGSRKPHGQRECTAAQACVFYEWIPFPWMQVFTN